MPVIELEQPGSPAKVPGQGTHVRAMIYAVLNARARGRQQMVVWRISGHFHLASDEGCPPHGLLLGDGRDRADPWPDKADKSDVGVRRVDNISNLSVRCSGVGRVQVRKCLLIPEWCE